MALSVSSVAINLQHRARRSALEELWRQGISGRTLLQRHTDIIDAQISSSFAGCPEAYQGIGLIALGGYGRRELFPFSDIDLLLLYDPKQGREVDAVVDKVFYPLWDMGLDVGHSVRTPDACLTDAGQDFFFQVALLDARLIAGSASLFQQFQESFIAKFIEGRRREFFVTLMEHRDARHQRFGQHSYMLEPQIKESRGGFRDIQSMLWTAQVMFGLKDTAALRNAGLMTAAEQENLDEVWDWLIRIRNRLHYISGRKNDQLFFEHQEEMARAFHFEDSDNLLGVEQFMRTVYSCLKTVSVTCDLFFEHVNEVLELGTPACEDQRLEKGIELRCGRIALVETDLRHNKSLLFRVFFHAAKTGSPIHYRTRRLIKSHLQLIDDRARRSRRLAKLFLDILAGNHNMLSVLEAMLETGLLSAYMPEIDRVRSLAQHDIYHMYTVDIHLLHTVSELQKLSEELPHIFQEVRQPSILYLAALLHDIGKGGGRDHAGKGAALVADIADRLGLAPSEKDVLVFLVREHLFLPHTALRRDLEDDELLRRCAETIGDPELLAMLYLLSVADARATGPSAWNDWKGALMLEFYLRVAQLLDATGQEGPDRKQAVAWIRGKIATQLPEQDSDLDVLPDDYLLSFKQEEIVKQINFRRLLPERKVLVFPEEREDCWSLLIMTTDSPGLLARICGVLALHNMKILAAQIFTWADGTVVDVFSVASTIDEKYGLQDWQSFEEDLTLAVRQRVGIDHRLSRKTAPVRHTRSLTISRRPPQVMIDNDSSEHYSVIEVYSDDRIGLLYDVAKTLSDFDLNIYRAIIGTRADQVVDVFYVQDHNHRKINDEGLMKEIHQSLLYVATKGIG
jgi:[protein-PII] uridylyltransferase